MALQTKTYTQSSNTFTLELTLVEQSTSTAGNSSTISYTLKLKSTTKNFAQYGVGAEVKLDNQTVAVRDRGSAPKITLGTYSEVTLLSGTHTVAHTSDGSKSMALAYSLDMASASYTPGAMSGSGAMTLTKIPRGATITSAPNFTDEDDPAVKVSNPAGVSVQLGIFKDSTHALADYRTISGTSYTFHLTQAEREAMRKVDTTKNTAQVRFYVKSTVGGQTFITYLTRTLTIQDPAPTLDPTVEDVNPATLALTGESGNLVKYHSQVAVTTGAQAVKGASLVRQSVTCGSQTLPGDGTLEGVESGNIVISATDSRGNTTTKTVTMPLVKYVKLTCDMGSGVPDGAGKFVFQVSGNFFNESFGAVANTLTVKYRYRKAGGTYSEYKDMTVSKSESSYTATVTITGLDYTQSYQFQAQAVDKLNTVTTEEKTVRSIPTFDWGEGEFNFNVELTIKGKTIFDWIYPVGSIYMSVNSVNPGTLFGGTWVAWGAGRVPVGISTSDTSFNTPEKTGGEKNHTLTISEIPSHKHRMTHLPYLWADVDDNASTNTTRLYGWNSGSAATRGGISWQKDETGWYEAIGGGSAHNNMPPYIVCYMWKRTA